MNVRVRIHSVLALLMLANMLLVAAEAVAHERLTNLDHIDFLAASVTPPAQVGHRRTSSSRTRRSASCGPIPSRATRATCGWAAERTTLPPTRTGRARTTPMTSHGPPSYTSVTGSSSVTCTVATRPRAAPWTGVSPDGRGTTSRERRCCGCSRTAHSTRVEPVELPDPGDSDASYWLTRTIWALGEGYAAFADEDPDFAALVRRRLDLAIAAVGRQVLSPHDGQTQVVDGLAWPAWLIADRADASSEAVYGLTAYVGAGGGDRAERVLRQLADGIAMMQEGTVRTWPFRALMPWAESRTVWHGWGDQMAGALASAGDEVGNGRTRWATADGSTRLWRRPAASHRICWRRAVPTTAGYRLPLTRPRSLTGPTRPCRTCSPRTMRPDGRAFSSWRG